MPLVVAVIPDRVRAAARAEILPTACQLLAAGQGVRIAGMLLLFLVVLVALFKTADILGDFGIRSEHIGHTPIKIAGCRF